MSRLQRLYRLPWKSVKGQCSNFGVGDRSIVDQNLTRRYSLGGLNTIYLGHFDQKQQSQNQCKYYGNNRRTLMTSSIYFGRTFTHLENNHSYSVVLKNPKYDKLLFHREQFKEDIVKKNVSLHPIVKEFLELSMQPESDLKPLDDDCYVDIISRIKNVVSSLSDTDLLLLLDAMKKFPFSAYPTSPNYKRLWGCIDQEFVVRGKSGIWTTEELFVMDDAWYPLDLTRFSSFHWFLIKRNFRKCERLNKEQFVRFMFCLNRTRKIHESINTYELEYNLQKLYPEMTADELCLVCLAFFKTQTPIRNMDLLGKILDIVTEKAGTIQPISIAAICKIIRLSAKNNCEDKVLSFLSEFVGEIDRLSVTACVHLALAGTNCNVVHRELMMKIIKKIEDNFEIVRLKEMEKIACATSMFNIKCESLWDKILEAISNPTPERQKEIEEYGRCLPAILHYFSYQEKYPLDLISRVLEPQYLKRYYGKNLYHYQRELLVLDLTTQIEIPEYSGNRLSEKARTYVLKYCTFWYDPATVSKVTQFKGNIRSIANLLEEVFGAPRQTLIASILPQYHAIEVLLCTDKYGKAVDIPDYIRKYEQYEPKFLQNAKSEISNSVSDPAFFHVFTLGSRNNLIYGTNEVLGKTIIRERQLKKLGYTVHRVSVANWMAMNNEERKKHLKDLILSSCKNENQSENENEKQKQERIELGS